MIEFIGTLMAGFALGFAFHGAVIHFATRPRFRHGTTYQLDLTSNKLTELKGPAMKRRQQIEVVKS